MIIGNEYRSDGGSVLRNLNLFIVVVAMLQALSISSLSAAEKRIALVIGNSNYKASGNLLSNPVNDAELMSRTLTSVGFQVTKLFDATRPQMRRAMLVYSRALRTENTVGIFYYAGHGMQVDGQNYLLPVDATPARKDELPLHGVSVGTFLRTLDSISGRDGRLNIVILDACRNNPFARGWRSVQRGLATVDAPTGTLIAYSTAPGDVASDGDGKNSPYTLALTEMISRPGLAIERTFKATRILVSERTRSSGKEQVPWESTSLRGDFYFVPGNNVLANARPEGVKQDLDEPQKKSLQGDVAARVFPEVPKNLLSFGDQLKSAMKSNKEHEIRGKIDEGLASQNSKDRMLALAAWFVLNPEFTAKFSLPDWLEEQIKQANQISNKRDRDYAFRKKVGAGGLRNLHYKTGGILQFQHDIRSIDHSRGTAWSIYRRLDDSYSGMIRLTTNGLKMNMRLAVGSRAKCSFDLRLIGTKLEGQGTCLKQSGQVGYAPFPVVIELD